MLRIIILLAASQLAHSAEFSEVPARQDEQPSEQATSEQAKEPPKPEAPRKPAARRAFGGRAGFVSRSTLRFAGQPDLPPYSLEAVYIFPERVRWTIQRIAEEEAPVARSVRYQFGGGVWELPPGATQSQAQVGKEALKYRLQNELRRVAMVWPAGLEWSPIEGSSLQEAQLGELGSLRVQLDEEGLKPLRLLSFLHDEDEAFESLEELRWRMDERGWWWPTSWRLESHGQPIWLETIDEVLLGRKYLESFFRPADLRIMDGQAAKPRAVKLAARVFHSTDLPAKVSWPDALAQAKSTLIKMQVRLGKRQTIMPRPVFLLDSSGRPTSFELRLQGEVEELPEGWVRGPAREGWSAVYHGLESLNSSALEALAKSLASDERPGVPFARVQEHGGRIGLVQLTLPFTAKQ